MNRSQSTAGRMLLVLRLPWALWLALIAWRYNVRGRSTDRLFLDLGLDLQRLAVAEDLEFHLFIQLSLRNETSQRTEALHVMPVEFADNVARLDARLRRRRTGHYVGNGNSIRVRVVLARLRRPRLNAKITAYDAPLFQ